MSRKLAGKDPKKYTKDERAYARQRPWLPQHPDDVSDARPAQDPGAGLENPEQPKPEETTVTDAPTQAQSNDDDLTEEKVRTLTVDELKALPEEYDGLDDVDFNQNKPELVEDIVEALFGGDGEGGET